MRKASLTLVEQLAQSQRDRPCSVSGAIDFQRDAPHELCVACATSSDVATADKNNDDGFRAIENSVINFEILGPGALPQCLRYPDSYCPYHYVLVDSIDHWTSQQGNTAILQIQEIS